MCAENYKLNLKSNSILKIPYQTSNRAGILVENSAAGKEDDLRHQQDSHPDQQQKNRTDTITYKWDMPTGRSGALPGLDQTLCSGPMTQVEKGNDLVVTESDSTFPPMNLNLEVLEWLKVQERTQTDSPGPTLPPQPAVPPREENTKDLSKPPLAPTRPPPAVITPQRPRPVATPVPEDTRPSALPGEVCTCLLRLSNFCQEVKDLAGEGGITLNLLFTRSKDEVERGFTFTSRG